MRTTLTSGKLDAADDDNDEQSEDFSDSENILDAISPVDTHAVDERQQDCSNTQVN